jgi:hypothetical protein
MPPTQQWGTLDVANATLRTLSRSAPFTAEIHHPDMDRQRIAYPKVVHYHHSASLPSMLRFRENTRNPSVNG